MTENTENEKKTGTLTMKPSTLQLTKTVKGGQIRQSFSHGRSKVVTVEVKKTRTFSRSDASGKMEEIKEQAGATSSGLNEQAAVPTLESGLTEEEHNARLRAVQQAAQQAADDKELEETAVKNSSEEEKESSDDLISSTEDVNDTDEQAAPEEAPQQEKEEDLTLATEEKIEETPVDDTPKKQSVTSKKQKEETKPQNQAPKRYSVIPEPEPAQPEPEKTPAKEAKKPIKTGRLSVKDTETKQPKENKSKSRKGEYGRKSAALTVTNALEVGQERVRSLASIKRAREKARRAESERQPAERVVRDVIVPEFITVQELGNRMAERTADVVRELMRLGVMANSTQTIDADTAELVIDAFGHRIRRVTDADVEDILKYDDTDESLLKKRAPIVTIMGHVDHGKTSLLDAIKQTDVAAGEAGGITQHIGAYRVELPSGEFITFLDTPGHEAFTAMRSRGAQVTDIVVLVVAADDGIKAQTIEAINHAKAAEVPIIVAVNKIDKPGADPSRVRNELLQHDLVPEELGGEIMVVDVSAHTKQGLDKLEEAILLQAELHELKANPNCGASGIVVESRLEKGCGILATLLVQRGTLNQGDLVVAGTSVGRIRTLSNSTGKSIEHAEPSVPVEVLGLGTIPDVGEPFAVVETEKQAREIAEYRERRNRNARDAAMNQHKSLEDLFNRASDSNQEKELCVILKTDVHGSAEAIIASLEKIHTDVARIKVLHSAVGGVSESDIALAMASNAIILGFNVRANTAAQDSAKREGIRIYYYSIIYNLIDDMKKLLGDMLDPILREEYLGRVEIRQVFNISKVGKIAGSFVLDGTVKRGAKVRLLRDDIVIHEGTLKALRRFKDDVKEVKEGFECGISFENYDDIREKDVVEVFDVIQEKQIIE